MAGSLEINKVIHFYVNVDQSQILLEPEDVTKEERVDFGTQIIVDFQKLLDDVIIEETEEDQIIRDYIIPTEFIKILQ